MSRLLPQTWNQLFLQGTPVPFPRKWYAETTVWARRVESLLQEMCTAPCLNSDLTFLGISLILPFVGLWLHLDVPLPLLQQLVLLRLHTSPPARLHNLSQPSRLSLLSQTPSSPLGSHSIRVGNTSACYGVAVRFFAQSTSIFLFLEGSKPLVCYPGLQ